MHRRGARETSVWMALAMGGVVLAMAAIYVGTGVLDGFGDWDLHRIGRRFRRHLPWALAAAAVAGPLLRVFYAALLRTPPAPGAVLLAVPRAFVHVALFGMLALVAILVGLGRRLLQAIGLVRRPAGEADDEHWLQPAAVPLWFILFPFRSLKDDGEGELPMPAAAGMKRRLLRWLPWVLIGVGAWAGAESESTGRRVDPYWLAAFASFWLGDYLLVAARVAPALRARERRAGD